MGEQWTAQNVVLPEAQPCPPLPPTRKQAATARWRAAEARVAELEAALFAIMRVTDPGDVRTLAGRVAWETLTPARKIAREALGLPLGGQVMIDGRWVDADV